MAPLEISFTDSATLNKYIVYIIKTVMMVMINIMIITMMLMMMMLIMIMMMIRCR